MKTEIDYLFQNSNPLGHALESFIISYTYTSYDMYSRANIRFLYAYQTNIFFWRSKTCTGVLLH